MWTLSNLELTPPCFKTYLTIQSTKKFLIPVNLALIVMSHLFQPLRLQLGGDLLVVQEEPGVHVLTEPLVGVAVVAVEVLGSDVHAGSHLPPEGCDSLGDNKS